MLCSAFPSRPPSPLLSSPSAALPPLPPTTLSLQQLSSNQVSNPQKFVQRFAYLSFLPAFSFDFLLSLLFDFALFFSLSMLSGAAPSVAATVTNCVRPPSPSVFSTSSNIHPLSTMLPPLDLPSLLSMFPQLHLQLSQPQHSLPPPILSLQRLQSNQDSNAQKYAHTTLCSAFFLFSCCFCWFLVICFCSMSLSFFSPSSTFPFSTGRASSPSLSSPSDSALSLSSPALHNLQWFSGAPILNTQRFVRFCFFFFDVCFLLPFN